MANTKDIYICLTPLHVLYATTLHKTNDNYEIVLIDQKGKLRTFLETLTKDSAQNPIRHLNSKTSKIGNLLDYLTYKTRLAIGQLSLTAKNLNKTPTATIYIFNDLAPETQYLLKKIPHTETVYIEDGSAPYNSHFIRRRALKKWTLSTFFPFYEPINILGTSSLVTRSLFSAPDHVRSENKLKPYSRLELDNSKLSLFTEKFQPKNSQSGTDGPTILLLAPYGTPAQNFMQQIEQTEAASLTASSYVCKRHPLDTLQEKASNEVDSRLPAEIIPALHSKITRVFGSRSTALQNIKLLYPQIQVYNVIQNNKTYYDIVLEAVGIKTLNTNRKSNNSE